MKTVIKRFGVRDRKAAAAILAQFGKRPTSEHLKAFLSSDQNFLVGALLGGAGIGLACGYELVRPDRGSMLFLYSIEVLPGYRRRGVARALISFLRELVAARQMKELFVFTTKSNKAARKLYQSTGGLIENGDDLLFTYKPERDTSRVAAAPYK